MNNNNNVNVLFVNSRSFYLSYPHLRPPPTSHHAVLAVLAQMLLAFIQLKFQGQNVSSFETYQKAIWVATVSLILYCFANEVKLQLPAYSRVIRRGMIVLGIVSSVSLTSILFPENHRLSFVRIEAANGTCREQERPASTASIRNESYGGLRVVCVSILLCSVLLLPSFVELGI
ncbi:hypothetical protein ACSBR2_015538 [Camellia fascicularis]